MVLAQMCGRFVITSPPDAIRQAFGYIDRPNFPGRFNVAPTQPVGVVIREHGDRHFRLMRWGFMPSWVKDPRKFTLLINARSETIREKPAFKNAIRRRRCVIPADGYYEWQQIGARKQPYYIHPRDGQPIGFAAIAETWMGPNGEELDTVAIITTAANAVLAGMHPRVPVTIAPADLAAWLDCSADDAADVMRLLRAPADDAFVWHPVSTDVNRVANDDAQLILPISEEEMATANDAAALKRPARKAAATTSGDDGQGSLF